MIGDGHGDSDRISSLPDSVLCHILSFLPTKAAVSTGILSNRWKDVWTLVPSFDLNLNDVNEYEDLVDDYPDDDYIRNTMFPKIVYRVLLLNKARTINLFKLTCGDNDWPWICDPADVISWISTAMDRHVKQLDLQLVLDKTFKLPTRFFICESIVQLSLTGSFYLPVPSAVHFPFLKKLHLEQVELAKDALEVLLSGCPLLESLCVEATTSVNLLGFIGGLRNIRILKLRNNTLEVLCCQASYDLPLFRNLVHLELDRCCWTFLERMLQQSPRLQVLVINGLMESCWKRSELVPACLSLHLRECRFTKWRGQQVGLNCAAYILENASVLKTMSIIAFEQDNLEGKFQVLQNLCVFPRGSETCQLHFT